MFSRKNSEHLYLMLVIFTNIIMKICVTGLGIVREYTSENIVFEFEEYGTKEIQTNYRIKNELAINYYD